MHKSNLNRRPRRPNGIKGRKTQAIDRESKAAAPTPSLSDERVSMAVSALKNNSTTLISECKTGSLKTISYNADVLATLRGLFKSDKTYRFQIHANNTYSSSVGGVVQIGFAANPGVTTFSEWTALAALFDECKLQRSTLGITSSGLLTKPIPLWIAFDHVTTTGSGVGFGNVQRLAGSQAVQSNNMNGGSARHVQSANISGIRAFGPTSVPTSTAVDVGMNGQWDISGQDSTAISTVVFYADMMNVVVFRNRA
jgi:hypothetical protein